MSFILNEKDDSDYKIKKRIDIIRSQEAFKKIIAEQMNSQMYSTDVIFSALFNATIDFYISIAIARKDSLKDIKEFIFKYFKRSKNTEDFIESSYKEFYEKFKKYEKNKD